MVASGLEDSVTLPLNRNMVTVLLDRSSYLLDHYTNFIALRMMPFKDIRNPWQSLYPLIASSGVTEAHRSLFHALIAQAAGNLACLDMESL